MRSANFFGEGAKYCNEFAGHRSKKKQHDTTVKIQ
jgi:hypothetical protein